MIAVASKKEITVSMILKSRLRISLLRSLKDITLQNTPKDSMEYPFAKKRKFLPTKSILPLVLKIYNFITSNR